MAPSPGGDTVQHASRQSLLTAAMGLTSLGAPVSSSSSSSSPAKNMASMESNRSGNHPAATATSALAAPSPPIFKKSPAGFGNPPAPFAHVSKDGSMATHQFSTSGQIAAMTSAGIDAPPPGHASHPQGSEAPLPVRDPVEPITSFAKSFPETLLEVLSSGEHSDVVAWLPHGRGFVVLDKERFASRVLPRHFDGSKFASFTRRMKRWGFDRVPRGPEMGAYYHREFRRDRPELVKEMRYPARGKFQEGKREEEEEEGADKLKKLVKKTVERQVQISLPEKVPVRLNSEAHAHVLQSQANPSLQDQGSSIPLPSASPVQQRITEIQQELLLTRSMLSHKVADHLIPGPEATTTSAFRARARSLANGSIPDQWPYHAPTYDVQRMIDVERAKRALEAESIAGLCIRRSEAIMASKVLASSKIHADIMDAGSCADDEHATQAATARENTTWLENQADLLRPSSFPLQIPDFGAPIDLREQRIAEIQRELLSTQPVFPRKVAYYLEPGSSANGSVPNQRPYSAPTYSVQRIIDVELAKRTLEAESISRLCIPQSSTPTDRANAINAIMASKILASSEIHANIMDAVARDLYSRSKPAMPVAVPSTELSPRRRSAYSLSSVERAFP